MPRKRLADPVKLSVVFEPDDGGWHVHVPSLQGCRTWGRSLSEARRNIREAISLQEEAFEDADAVARDAVFEENIQLPADARALLGQARAINGLAEAVAVQAKALSVLAARRLAALTSLRDAGELLHLSQEGVRKLVKTPDVVVRLDGAMTAMEVKGPVVFGIPVDERLAIDERRAGVFVIDDAAGLQSMKLAVSNKALAVKPPAKTGISVPSSRPPARPRRARSAHSGKNS